MVSQAGPARRPRGQHQLPPERVGASCCLRRHRPADGQRLSADHVLRRHEVANLESYATGTCRARKASWSVIAASKSWPR